MDRGWLASWGDGGYAHRISASALRTRGLVQISGRGKAWRAELTDRGREQLERLGREPAATPTRGKPGSDHQPLARAEDRSYAALDASSAAR